MSNPLTIPSSPLVNQQQDGSHAISDNDNEKNQALISSSENPTSLPRTSGHEQEREREKEGEKLKEEDGNRSRSEGMKKRVQEKDGEGEGDEVAGRMFLMTLF